ncbi:MAG TPA: hypothetical protein VGE34_02725 [Candidatus Saccharimonadales bacterium]
MKKRVTIGALIGSFIVFLLTIDIANLAVRLITVGELPDGSTILSADTMLFLTVAALSIVFAGLILALASRIKMSSTRMHALPKRRYSQVQ